MPKRASTPKPANISANTNTNANTGARRGHAVHRVAARINVGGHREHGHAAGSLQCTRSRAGRDVHRQRDVLFEYRTTATGRSAPSTVDARVDHRAQLKPHSAMRFHISAHAAESQSRRVALRCRRGGDGGLSRAHRFSVVAVGGRGATGGEASTSYDTLRVVTGMYWLTRGRFSATR
jgi:hypothetical protein